jgi:hypothetical protein
MAEQFASGDIVSVVVDSSLRETERGSRYQWVKFDDLEGLMNLRSTEAPFVEGETVQVEIIPKGNLGKDFKCKVHVPPVPQKLVFAKVLEKTTAVVASADPGDLKQFKFSVPRGTPIAEHLERKTDEWQARYGGTADIARGRWLTEVLG